MELFELKADIREKAGKGISRQLRMKNAFPAILYGPKTEPVKISVDTKSFETAFKKSDSAKVVVNLSVTGSDGTEKKRCPAIVKDVQLTPLTKELLHADFLEIDLDKKMSVSVPVETFGKAKGVELGGTLQVARRELEIFCLPVDIPASIRLDVSKLGINESILVNDIVLPGIEIPSDTNFTVVTVVAPKSSKDDSEEEEE